MEERQNKLLKEIVETYIKTVKPVGSKSLCNKFKCSSATIRNEMAKLEELGLIEKNHISSGRIPSEKGYRYYVEHLMEPENLTGKDVLKLQKIFSNNELELSDAISKCMEIISDITNYTSVVLGKNSADNNLQKVDIISLDSNHIVALVCTDKGIVENKKFTLDDGTNIKEIIKTSEIINKLLIGTPINKVSERLEFEIKPIIIKQMTQYETVYNIFYNAFNDFVENNNANFHINGKSKIFNQPEYDDVDDLKRLANKLDDIAIIKSIEDYPKEDDIKIYIGKENKLDNDVTVIKKNYELDGSEGTIAVIGPKRMDYKKIISLLKFVDKNIDERKDE